MPATRSQEQEAQLQAVQQLANDTAAAVEQLRQDLIASQTNQLTAESLMTLLDKRDQRLTAIIRPEPSLLPNSSNPMAPGILGSGPSKPTHTDERPTQGSTPRLLFPRFSSGDPSVWLFNVSQFFQYYHTHPEDRLLLAAMHLDAPAATWYQGLVAENYLPDWDAFTRAIRHRFGPSEYEDATALLAKLSQTGSVLDYQAAFENLASKVRGLTPAHLRSLFISGLQLRIRMAVQAHRPVDLHDAFALARMYESQFSEPRNRSLSPRPLASPHPSASATAQPPLPRLPVKRLSAEEMQVRRDKGLCFNCDEKFVRGHRCKGRPTLLYLEGFDDPDDVSLPTESETIEINPPEPEISYNALLGQRSAKSMRMTGMVRGQSVQVLVDGGSTHNFLSTRMSKFLALPLSPITPFQVLVGNGDALRCTAVCRDVPVLLQTHLFTMDQFVLDLQGTDIVLGVQWLETLGPVLTDHANMTMEFQHHGQPVRLQGDPSLRSLSVSSSGLLKLMAADGISACYMCLSASSSDQPPTDMDAKISLSVQTLLAEYDDLFVQPTGLPPARDVDHRIPLKADAEAVNVRPYRYPHYQKHEIERLVTELLQDGIIRPSRSAFSSPVLLVKKKDGSWRFCVDYRELNAVTIRDRFPIPTVDELLDELHGAVIFSKLDLRSGYHQIRMDPSDVHKTAFRTHHGHYEFLVMPFGLTNAPSTFQALMNEVFRPFLRRFVVIFFDDILVYSKNLDLHLDHLHQVFVTLRHHHLAVKQSKCSFATPTVEFLGHIVSAHGVSADPAKLEAVRDWPIPTTPKQVRGFLGLTGYYRRFIRHYATIAAPLTDLLIKDGFAWSAQAEHAFNSLKEALSHAPVLALPDFAIPFAVETDASGVGIGAVLMQSEHPLAFYSRKLSPLMRTKSTYVRELFAIQCAVQKWRQYLLGAHFIIRTDHRPLHHLLKQTIQTPEQQQFLSKLVGFDYSIEYKPGKKNAAADALSRVYEDVNQGSTFFTLSRPVNTDLDTLRVELLENQRTKSIIDDLQRAPESQPGWSYSLGLLRHRGRLFLPADSSLVPVLLSDYHSSLHGGHSGVQRTLQRISAHFQWDGMRKDIAEFVQACDVCQKCKPTNHHPYGLLQPITPPDSLWTDLSMDFITHLPPSAGCTTILVVVDRFSKGAHLASLLPHYTATKVAQAFWNTVGKLHGIPHSIISDRDPIFQSAFWKELFRLQGTKLHFSSAYHPQSDGQTERVNRCIEQFLRSFVHGQPSKWSKILSWAEYHYNTTFQASTGMTPFEVTFGRKPPSLLAYCAGTSAVEAVDHDLRSRDIILSQLRANLSKAQAIMKTQADKHRTDITFNPGDMVLLRLHPYRQLSVRKDSAHKLGLRYYGPFPVEERVGQVAYRLSLPASSRIHPVFHCSLLKPYMASQSTRVHPLPDAAVDHQPIHKPLAILGQRVIMKDSKPVSQVLVQWQDLAPEDSSWEDEHLLDNIRLEDKSSLYGGRIVTPQELQVYSRRKNMPKQG